MTRALDRWVDPAGRSDHQSAVGERMDRGENALNAVRLLLAADVILFHTWQHLGPALPWAARQAFGELPVDAFFTISGFLILRSWQHRPSARAYLTARAARILPGLWTCLVVTAFLVVPVAGLMSGTGSPTVASRVEYVVSNAGVWLRQTGFDGGPSIPTGSTWDGQLWSLGWEASCYLVLLGLGLAGLLIRRVVTGIFAAAAFWGLVVLAANPPHAIGTLYTASRLVPMFSAGMLLYVWRDHVPVNGRLAGLAAVVLAASFVSANYWAIAALPVAYICLYLGLSLGRFSILRLPNDLSYGVYIYGSPVLALLLVGGVTVRPWPLFGLLAVALTLPVAAASWFMVEQPAMRWAKRRTRHSDGKPVTERSWIPAQRKASA